MGKAANIYEFLGSFCADENKQNCMIIVREPIGCDCRLVAYSSTAYIEYDFSKYGKSKTHEYRVPLNEIDQHLEALKANLQIYENTCRSTPKVPVSFKGLRNMFICVNTKKPGVCIDKFYFPIANKMDYTRLEEAFKKAKLRAYELMDEISNCTLAD